jgi:hypothetical protein
MAAVTVVRRRSVVIGNRRMIVATLNIANTNTWATGLKIIEAWDAPSVLGAVAIGGTVSGGTITFATTGAENGANVVVIGQ